MFYLANAKVEFGIQKSDIRFLWSQNFTPAFHTLIIFKKS
ncbi:Uncharacterized protein dnm_063590 [Desulfonema magnum]|uniref:Uncharacterized protein n=1 Tax=Desulfonema magnum TaxID=45655 RepID=A0A975GRT4_9BACT|nr:Uncharacterized protein dnm_063590 [Desulfonema magnum]